MDYFAQTVDLGLYSIAFGELAIYISVMYSCIYDSLNSKNPLFGH
jgi:hypothetical protein